MSARRVGWVLVWMAMAASLQPRPCPGQDASELRVALGPALDAHSDLLASPFRQGGTGFAAALEYVRGGFSLSVAGSIARTSSELEARRDGGDEDVWAGALGARWVGEVGAWRGLHLRAGVGLGAFALVRRHHYVAYRGPQSEIFGDLLLPLSAVGGVRWEGGGGTTLEEELEVALVMGMLESPFAGSKFVPPATVGGLWDTRMVTHRLALSHPLSAAVSFRLEHRLRFLDAERGRPLRSLQQELFAGLGLRLWGGGS